MKIIGIDGNEANVEIKAGIGRYAFELLWAVYRKIGKEKDRNIKFVVFLKDEPRPDMPKESDYYSYKVLKGKSLWVQIKLMPYLWKEKAVGKKYDYILSLTHYSPLPCPYKSIVCIMDLAYIHYPEMFKKIDFYKLKYWTHLSLLQSHKIITISNFSKSEIEKYYSFTKRKITVIYPGVDFNHFDRSKLENKKKLSEVLEKYKIKGEYILFIGTSQPRKNLLALLDAYLQLRIKHKIKLVITGMVKEGRGGWMYEELLNKIDRHNLNKEVITTGYADDNDIPYIIGGAKALIIPSLYEGFGLPVVEAISMGVPVVISRNSSLEEIGCENSIYIEKPFDSKTIVSALYELYAKNTRLSSKIPEEISKFSHFECVKQFMKLIENNGNNSSNN